MVYDSVHVFARGLDAATVEGPELRIRNLSCEDELPWKEGSTLFNFISSVQVDNDNDNDLSYVHCTYQGYMKTEDFIYEQSAIKRTSKAI